MIIKYAPILRRCVREKAGHQNHQLILIKYHLSKSAAATSTPRWTTVCDACQKGTHAQAHTPWVNMVISPSNSCVLCRSFSCCIFISFCKVISCTVQRLKNTEEVPHAAAPVHVKTHCTQTKTRACQHTRLQTRNMASRRTTRKVSG